MRNILINEGKIRYFNLILITVIMSLFFSQLSRLIELSNLIFNQFDSILYSLVTIFLIVQWTIILINQFLYIYIHYTDIKFLKPIELKQTRTTKHCSNTYKHLFAFKHHIAYRVMRC